VNKEQVAQVLNDIATLLDLKGENPFKSRAYSNAARVVESLTEPMEKVFAPGTTDHIKGIGESLHEKIVEMVSTGRLAYFEELRASVPAGLVDMLSIPGLGPKKIRALHEALGVVTMDELEKVCQMGKVAELKGFGEKSQSNILEGIHYRRIYASRHLLADALVLATPILDALREHPDVIRCSTAGSLRRSKEVIGDVDFLASSKNPIDVIDYFTKLPEVTDVIVKGETKTSVHLLGGIQADLRVVSDVEYPFALAYFTGCKEHNIVMRQRAISRGLRLNEYGLFKSTEETRDPALRLNCRTEDEIFQELGLAYIPPELREDKGEFEVAEKDRLPRLIDWMEIKGSLHNHSDWSDGRNTLEEIAEYMQDLGCAYWGITDHSRSSYQAHGLTAERLRQQIAAIRGLNEKFASEGVQFRFISGSEVDILPDGSLDFDNDLLAELDIVIASVHSGFTQSEADMTERVIKAVRNPLVHMIGHLTGRLLLEREPFKIDSMAVIDACAETGTWIELNANPYRCDMDWRLWRHAAQKGVKCVINCDAHRNENAQFIRLGAGIARKGWLTKNDVINTLPYPALMEALRKKRGKY
jgi:DNA polymerase (family 10)